MNHLKNESEVSILDVQEIIYHLSTHQEKYIERFEQIEKGKNKFNFCAGFFSNLWLAYQLMFSELFIISVIGFGVKLILTLWVLSTGIHYENVLVVARLLLYSYRIIKVILFGFFGDRLLYRSIKNRIINNRRGKVSIITWITASEKTVVFRGTAVITCGIIMLLLSDHILPFLIDWIIY